LLQFPFRDQSAADTKAFPAMFKIPSFDHWHIALAWQAAVRAPWMLVLTEKQLYGNIIHLENQ
jgi:hypothetical protein